MTTTEAPKNISPEERLKLWVRAGGRCQLCNEYLLEDDLTRVPKLLGEMAHNVGRKQSPRSPRGTSDLPIDQRNLADNLLLLCAQHHAVIDSKIAQGEFTIEELHRIKAEHEERIHYLTGLGADAETVVLRMYGDIRGTAVEIPDDDVRAAVRAHARRFPRSPLSYQGEGIDIDLRDLTATEGTAAYWQEAGGRIERVVGGRLRDGIERGEVRHLSVFGLARIPALVLLGHALDDKLAIDIYQRHRSGETWSWDPDAAPVDFEHHTVVNGADPDNVALLLSLSGSIAVGELPPSVTAGTTIYEIRPIGVTPHRDLLRSCESLQAFEHCYHAFLSRLEQERPNARAIDVFPAIPVSAAIAVGRGLMRDVHPSLRIYDREAASYTLAVEINK